MKNLYKSVLVIAAAALTFASCQKETLPEQSTLKTVNFVAQTLETKTAFGTPSGTTYPTLWTSNDSKVKVAINGTNAKDADLSAASDGKTATFSLQVEDPSAESYIFDVVSPASAALSITAEKGWNISVPTTQTPLANSVDENAQVLTASSKSFSTFPEEVSLNFNHFTAYGKLTISNLQSGASVSSITLTAESNWAGRWNYKDGVATENSASATITLNTTSTSDVWFACAPVDLSNKTIKVTVATDKGDFEKTITVPSGKKFESGKIAEFSVNFSGVEPKADAIYSLVTSTDALTVGSEVIIVGFGDKGTVALSTTQNNNNRGIAGVTVESDKVKNPSDGVQVFTLEFGELGNSVAFYDGEGDPDAKDKIEVGYIYAASSSSNYMRTEKVLSKNSSFEVKIDGGVATITAQGEFTRNVIQYNEGSTCFSCYGSASQKPVKIFKKDGSGTSQKIINGEIEKPVGKTYASLAALVAAGEPTGETVTVTLSDEVITGFYIATSSSTGEKFKNGVYFNVGGREIEIYCKGAPAEWEVGGKVSGTLTCPWKSYNGTWELTPSSYAGLTYKDGGSTPPTPPVTGGTTVTKSISEISGTTTNGAKVSSMTLDSVISATASGAGNNGKVYSDGAQWRFYQADGGTLTISASGSHELASVKLTYTNDKGGVMLYGSETVASGTPVAVSGKSVTFSVGNSGSATNGQVRITEIEVSYN